MTAQDHFIAMLRDRVAPALRDLGLKGSGQTFIAQSEDCWLLVGFQKSAYSDSSLVTFTVNVTAANKAAWAAAQTTRPHLPNRPSPNVFYGSFIWQSRIGNVMPGGKDHWWRLDPHTDPAALAEAVIEAIRDFALPAMRAATGSPA